MHTLTHDDGRLVNGPWWMRGGLHTVKGLGNVRLFKVDPIAAILYPATYAGASSLSAFLETSHCAASEQQGRRQCASGTFAGA